MRRAADVMTQSPLTVAGRAPVAAAAERMDRHHVRQLLVVERDGALVGVLRREVCERVRGTPGTAEGAAEPVPVAPEDLPLESLVLQLLGAAHDLVVVVRDRVPVGVFTTVDALALAAALLPDELVVAEIATHNVVVAPPGWSVQRARSELRDQGIRHLPIVRDGRLIGIVSERDLAALAPDADLRLLEVASPPTEVAVGDTRAREAAARMVAQKVRCMPVLGLADELTGIVSSTDVLRALARHIAAAGAP